MNRIPKATLGFLLTLRERIAQIDEQSRQHGILRGCCRNIMEGPLDWHTRRQIISYLNAPSARR